MRIAALVLGLLGSLILLGIGAVWTENADRLKEAEEMAQTSQEIAKEAAQASGHAAEEDPQYKELMLVLEAVRGKAKASYAMFACGFVAFIASFFAFKFARVSGGIMALAVLVPAVLYVGSLFVSFPLALGALFAFLAKPKPKQPKPAAA
jgi:hypothetical protein